MKPGDLVIISNFTPEYGERVGILMYRLQLGYPDYHEVLTCEGVEWIRASNIFSAHEFSQTIDRESFTQEW